MNLKHVKQINGREGDNSDFVCYLIRYFLACGGNFAPRHINRLTHSKTQQK